MTDTAASERAYNDQLLWLRCELSWIEVEVRVIEHDPNAELGYIIRTAYPRNYNPRYGR